MGFWALECLGSLLAKVCGCPMNFDGIWMKVGGSPLVASPKLPVQENCEKLRAPVKSWDGSTTNHADGLPATMLFETRTNIQQPAILAALQLLKSQQCGGLWRKLRKLGNKVLFHIISPNLMEEIWTPQPSPTCHHYNFSKWPSVAIWHSSSSPKHSLLLGSCRFPRRWTKVQGKRRPQKPGAATSSARTMCDTHAKILTFFGCSTFEGWVFSLQEKLHKIL